MPKRSEPTPSPAEPEDLTSRSDVRRARKTREEALARLAREIVSLGPRLIERLGLPETVLDAVYEARAISSPRARERQLRVVRNTLRDAEWAAIRDRLDELTVHGTVRAAARPAEGNGPEAPERVWVVRLLGEGKSAMDALIAEHPNADRKHLGQLIRNIERSSPERRKRAEAKLASTLRFMLQSG